MGRANKNTTTHTSRTYPMATGIRRDNTEELPIINYVLPKFLAETSRCFSVDNPIF